MEANATKELHIGQASIAGNATIHKVCWTRENASDAFTVCGADTRFQAKRLHLTDKPVTCKRCGA